MEALVEALTALQGAALVASTLETDVLPSRVLGYRPADLDELCTSGDLVWIGAGGVGSNDGRVRLFFRDQVHVLVGAVEPGERPDGPIHDALRGHLAARGASFWQQIRTSVLGASDTELLAALWDLVWAGELTNDSLAPLRAVVSGAAARKGGSSKPPSRTRGRPRPGRLTAIGPPAAAGRWSLVAPLLEPAPTPTEAAHASALQLLERHGVLTREAVLAEGVTGGFASVYGVLKVLEERGQVRRGYFVTGLGAAQFALPGAVDRLRSVRDAPEEDTSTGALVLAATDPAQPYGASLAWPDSPGRPARAAGALVVLSDGQLLAWLDRRGHHLVTFAATTQDRRWADALASLVKDGRLRSLEVRKIDGQPVVQGPISDGLRSAGFVEGYRGLVLRL
jgi:ATP-dependent Lhr-like helicase